jgi:hypothetical protein
MMNYTKVRLPKTDQGAQAFAELAKQNRVVGVRENGEIVYQIPTCAVEKLDELSVPYEVLASGLLSPARPTQVH